MESVEVDFDKKTADLTMKPGKSLSQADCERAFAGSRYAVKSFEPLAPTN